MAGSAVRTKTLSGWRGDAAVYALTPPFAHKSWGSDEARDLSHVVVSAVHLDYGGFGVGLRDSETMIFPSDGEDATDFGELVMVPHMSHEDALAELGYEVSA